MDELSLEHRVLRDAENSDENALTVGISIVCKSMEFIDCHIT